MDGQHGGARRGEHGDQREHRPAAHESASQDRLISGNLFGARRQAVENGDAEELSTPQRWTVYISMTAGRWSSYDVPIVKALS